MSMINPVESTDIAVIDELGNTVGMLLSSPQTYSEQQSNLSSTNVRYPVPCSKQTSVTTQWLKENFVENVFTSVPRSIMFEEYINYCCDKNTKPFNQAVFGKVVRACFPNLSTRRLGVRGQSRYHYAGLSVKPTSIYAERLKCNLDKYNLSSLNNGIHSRHRESTTHIHVDQTIHKPHKSKYRSGLAKLVIPPYPSVDDILLQPFWSRDEMALFLNYYRSYSQQLLASIISLNFDKTYNHVCNFSVFLPEACRKLLQTHFICDLIAILDDIMYLEANASLIPDCLATLTSDFNVTLRKLAKALPSWIGEDSNRCGFMTREIINCRVQSAKQWGDHVRRVTTLCHVTKEARKTLTYPSIVVPLLNDLQSIPIKDIAEQCSFAGSNMQSVTDIPECELAQRYMKRFCDLLRDQVSVEFYAHELERIVEKHAGLKKNVHESGGKECKDANDLTTDQTRSFIMKWAAYGSKILTEITLKSSESVGPFHLVMLLFGDYVNHVVSLRNEQAWRMVRLRSSIRSDSSYFNRMWASSTAHGGNDKLAMPSTFLATQYVSVAAQPIPQIQFERKFDPLINECPIASKIALANNRTLNSKKTKLSAQVANVVANMEQEQARDVLFHRNYVRAPRPSFFIVPTSVIHHPPC